MHAPGPTNFDLHCHSVASDGVLTPAALVRRAHANGVEVLALTDHDEVTGVAEARACAEACGMRLVAGVEVSVTWNAITVHVLGLAVDPSHPTLLGGLEHIRASRARRAERMAAEFDGLGIPGSLAGAYAYAENPSLIGRTHFARFLVERGMARDVRSVFKRYLATGKPGYVPHEWAALGEAVGWIRASGGRAVIAHPGRYTLSPEDRARLFDEFRSAGGEGIEVVTGSHTPAQYHEYAALAREFGFLGSRGSDFHGPGESEVDLGRLPVLPAGLTPVWHDW
jgi:predicted metal-dependent phosphoesterase TrpH